MTNLERNSLEKLSVSRQEIVKRGTLTLNDVTPGERKLLSVISNCMRMKRKGITALWNKYHDGRATVKYSGSITPKTMKLDLNVVMADPKSWLTNTTSLMKCV